MLFYKNNKPFFIFLLFVNLLFSQKQPSKNYTSDNYLPNNTVRSLLIDSESILWVGTDNGVIKKENNVFTRFFEEDGLAMNNIWSIVEDADKNIWFGSYGGGLTIYNGTTFKVISKEDGLVDNEITKLFLFKNYLCVGTSYGVSLIDIKTHKLISCLPNTKENFRVSGFFEFKNQLYCTTYNAGVYKITKEANQLGISKINDYSVIHSVYATKDSIYLSNKGFFTKNSLASFVDGTSSKALQKRGTSIIWDYVETKNNNLFAAAWGMFSNDGGVYEIIGNKFVSKSSEFNLTSNNVLSLVYDEHFNNLYIGTRDAGLFEVNLDNYILFNDVSDSSVLGFAKTNKCEATLLTTSVVLNNFKKKHIISLEKLKEWQLHYLRNTTLPLPKYEDKFYELEYETKAKDIKFYDIKAFNNNFWVNTNIGLFTIKNSGELERYLPVHTEEINFTSEGNLIETNPYHGLRVYSDLDKFKYKYYPKLNKTTPSMIVNSLKTDDKTYFLSIFSGLYVWRNNEFISYSHSGIWSENKLRHITALANNLAISNEFGDVFILNDETSFKVLQKIPRSKIKGNTISFLEQYKGYLLIGTEKGITFYKNEQFIFIDQEQGLNQPILCAEVFGDNLEVGSDNGFYTLNLNHFIKAKPLVNALKLRGVYINNGNENFDYLAKKAKLNLAYNQNTLTIKFTTNIHPFPNKLSYRYRLNKDESWSNSSTSPEIYLPYLPPGNFAIEINVIDDSAGGGYREQILQLNITPPYWKSWWFVVLILIVLGAIIYSIYLYEIKKTKRFEAQKRVIQKRFEETKMEVLLAQMNPHFIFNAMNSIQSFIMDSDVDNATLFLGDFSKLIRQNLEYCTKPTILLVEEIEYLQLYVGVENTRFNNQVLINFEIDPLIDVYDVEIPSLLLQPFVENVFVHAFPPSILNPTLKISFKIVSKDLFQCIIEDNGIGLLQNPSNELHQSKGILLVKERLKLLGYNVDQVLKIDSSASGGVCVIVQLHL